MFAICLQKGSQLGNEKFSRTANPLFIGLSWRTRRDSNPRKTRFRKLGLSRILHSNKNEKASFGAVSRTLFCNKNDSQSTKVNAYVCSWFANGGKIGQFCLHIKISNSIYLLGLNEQRNLLLTRRES